jgi:hypothetical protein
MEEIEQDLDSCPEKYSSWFKIAFPKLKEWRERLMVDG